MEKNTAYDTYAKLIASQEHQERASKFFELLKRFLEVSPHKSNPYKSCPEEVEILDLAYLLDAFLSLGFMSSFPSQQQKYSKKINSLKKSMTQVKNVHFYNALVDAVATDDSIDVAIGKKSRKEMCDLFVEKFSLHRLSSIIFQEDQLDSEQKKVEVSSLRGKITNLLDSRSYKETKASEARKWANQMWRVFIEFVLLSPRVLIPDDLQETYFFYLVKKRCPEIRNSVSIIKNITMQDVADTLKSSGQTMQDGKVHLSNQRNLCVLMNAVVTLAVLRSNNQIAKCLQKIGKATKRFQKMDAQDPDVARSAQEISTQLAAMQQIVKDAGAIREAGREGNPVLTLNSGICTVGKCKTHLERLVETSKYIERRSKECSSKIVSITRDAIVKEQGKLSFFNRLKTKFWY